jgi:hypothetical protein
MFETPEKQSDGSYSVRLQQPIEISEEFTWKRGDARPIVDLKGQAHIQTVREAILTRLAQNKSLFKTAPSVASLRAITPVWGMMVLPQNKVEWSSNDIWTNVPRESDAVVILRVMGVQISRQSILPIWGGQVRRTLPEAGQIDLDFAGEDDGESVHSDELEEESGNALCLKDPAERKRQMKEYVRSMLREASEARMKADTALDRFYAEYDLSENESEFSEEDD